MQEVGITGVRAKDCGEYRNETCPPLSVIESRSHYGACKFTPQLLCSLAYRQCSAYCSATYKRSAAVAAAAEMRRKTLRNLTDDAGLLSVWSICLSAVRYSASYPCRVYSERALDFGVQLQRHKDG